MAPTQYGRNPSIPVNGASNQHFASNSYYDLAAWEWTALNVQYQYRLIR